MRPKPSSQTDCRFFTYGKGSKTGECRYEKVGTYLKTGRDPACTALQSTSTFDFYELTAGSTNNAASGDMQYDASSKRL